jgi:hypothetical protein
MSGEKMALRDQLWTALYPRFFLNKKALSQALDVIMPLLAALQAPCVGTSEDLGLVVPLASPSVPSREDDTGPATPSGETPRYRCTRCGENEINARANGCVRGPCPMEFTG